MGHEVIYILFMWCPNVCELTHPVIGNIFRKFSSLEECEKYAVEELRPSAPADEGGRHYYWITDEKGRIIARADDWWECRDSSQPPSGTS
jgi:hypothetical protein